MSIASEIERLQGAKSDIKGAIEAKNVTVPSSAKLDTYDDYIAQIGSNLQEKSATPTTTSQEIVADSGYDGLSKVTVAGDANLVASNILKDTSIFGVTGSVEPYVAPNLQDKTVTPTAAGSTVSADGGYDGLDTVTINGDANLIAGNVKKDVTIFGVTGTLDPQAEPNLQDKTVTPTASTQVVSADSGYDGLDEVTVNGDNNLVAENIKKNVSIFGVTGSYEGGGGGGTSDLNVFVQTSEPQTKNGVWIKSNVNSNKTKFLYYSAIEGQFLDPTATAYMTLTSVTIGRVIVGGYLYIFGQSSASSYVCDLSSNTITSITVPSISVSATFGACVYNGIIYIFYAPSSDNKLYYYTYNPEAGTYTEPIATNKSGIYGYGTYNLSNPTVYGNIATMYDTINSEVIKFNFDTKYVSTTTLSLAIAGVHSPVGQYRYYMSGTSLVRYDTTNNSVTTVKTFSGISNNDMPIAYVTNNYAYIFYGRSLSDNTSANYYYKYDINNDVLETVQTNYYYKCANTGGALAIEKNIFLLDSLTGKLYITYTGGSPSSTTIYCLQLEESSETSGLETGTALIETSSTEKYTKISDDANLYTGVKDTYLVTSVGISGYHMSCWGDGKKWNLIKNPSGETCTVSFDLNGGTGTIASQTITCGTTATEPQSAPTKTGEAFDCWYLDDRPFDFDTKIVTNTTLVAHYVAYTEISYIQSTGTQYIDTGFVPNYSSGFNIEIDFKPTILGNRYCLASNYVGGTESTNVSCEVTASNEIRLYENNGAVSITKSGVSLQGNSASFEYSNGTSTCSLDGSSATSSTSLSGSITNSIYLFVDRALRFSTFSSSLKIYSCKIYEGSTLVRDFQPIQLTDTEEYCMVDKVSNKIYHNAGSGDFIGGDSEPPVFLEYIQSNGSQYIDTTSKANSSTKIEFKYMITIVSGDYSSAFGAKDSSNNTLFVSNAWGDTRAYYFHGNNGYMQLGNFSTTYNIATYDVKNSQIKNYNGGTGNTDSTTVSFPSFPNLSLYLFARNNIGTAVYAQHGMKLWYYKEYSNGVLVKELLPCKDENNVVCLWDSIAKEYYYNSGSGTFTGGS